MSDTAPVRPYESASELQEQHALQLEGLDRAMEQVGGADAETVALRQIEPPLREFLERAAATGVYLEAIRDRTACQALIDYWVSSLAQAGVQAPATHLAKFDAMQLPVLPDEPRPYVGLEAFRSHEYFFGRDDDVARLLQQLADSPLVVVMGASGSGKSSLILGGVLPALAAHDAPMALRIAPVAVPGNDVLLRLAEAAVRAVGRPDTGARAEAATLLADPGHLAVLLGESPLPTLIVVDQFEEVFTLAEQVVRDAAAAALAALLEQGRGHRVILTMREEFRSRLVQLEALTPYLDHAWYSMRPMLYEELRAAVEQPAAKVNLHLGAGIADDLVKKVLGQPAALPLLQFTLRELWNRRDRNRITREVYDTVGDPLNALKTSADGFYDGLAPQTQDEARRILLELVRVDELLEAYRQPVPKSLLLRAGKANTEAALKLLADNDYVHISADDGDPIVEVKHEALIRNWPRLVGWIDEKRVERRQRLALSQTAQRWSASGRPRGGLLTGWQLEEAKRQSDLSEVEREFVDESAAELELEERKREAGLRREALRLRSGIGLLTAALVITIGALFVAYREWHRASELGRSNKSRELAAYAVQQADNDPNLGLLLAQTAYRQSPTVHAVGALQYTMGRSNALYVLRSDEPLATAQRALAPDGRSILSARPDDSRHWIVEATDIDVDRTRTILTTQSTFSSATLSPGGRFLYGTPRGGKGPSISVWDTRNGQQLIGGTDATVVLRSIRFIAEAAAIAIDAEGRLHLWRPDKPLVELKGGFPGTNLRTVTAQLSTDGTRLVMTSKQTEAVAWDVESGDRIAAARIQDAKVVASADGWHVAFFERDRVQLKRLHPGDVKSVAELHHSALPDSSYEIDSVAFLGAGPPGLLVEVSKVDGSDKRLLVWKPSKPAKSSVEQLATDVSGLSISGDGRFIAWVGRSPSVMDLTAGTTSELKIPVEPQDAKLVFMRDSRRLALLHASGRITLIDAGSGGVVSEFVGHTRQVQRIDVTEDGQRMVSIDRAGEARAWELPTTARSIELTTPAGGPWAGDVKQAIFTQDRHLLIAGFGPEGLGTLDRTTRKWRAAPLPGDSRVGRLFASADAQHVLSIDSDGRARVWSAADARLLATLTPQSREPPPSRARTSLQTGFRFGRVSNDGGVAWTYEAQADILTVWNVANAAQAFALAKQKDEPKQCGTLSPDARWLAVCFGGGKPYVRVYEVSQQTEHVNLHLDAEAVDVHFSADGRYAVAEADNRTADVYRTDTWERVSTLRLRAVLARVQFSADGARLLSIDSRGTVRTFEVATGRLLAEIRHEREVVTAADLSLSAEAIAIGTDAGALKIWDARTGRQLAAQPGVESVLAVQFDTSSREVAAVRADGTLTVLGCDLCVRETALIELADRKLTRLKRTLSDEERRFFIE